VLKIKTYRDAKGQYRWSAVDGNNRIVADSAESYRSEGGLKKALANVLLEFRGDVVFEQVNKRKFVFEMKVE
jgi:uncharacterized protein YegP (UPF0339 family)